MPPRDAASEAVQALHARLGAARLLLESLRARPDKLAIASKAQRIAIEDFAKSSQYKA